MKNLLTCIILLFSLMAQSQQISVVPISKLSSDLSGVEHIAFSDDGLLLVAADKKGVVQLWDTDALQVLAKSKIGSGIILIEFINNNQILIVQEDGTLSFLSNSNLSEINTVEIKDKIVRASLDPEKAFLSYVNKDDFLKIYSLRASMQQSSIDLSARLKSSLYLGYDRFGQQLVTLAKDGTAVVCNPVNQEIIREAKLRSDQFSGSASVIHAAGSNKGSDLFVVGVQEVFIPKGGLQGNQQPERRNSIITYDWDTSQGIKQINTNYAVDELVLGPGPAHITYFSKNHSDVTIVDLSQGAEVSQVTVEEYPKVISISADDSYLAAAGKSGTVYLYALERNAAPQIRITKPSINRGYGDAIHNSERLELEGVLSNDTKIKNVTINNIPAEILPSGKFAADINLVPGKNKIRVIAEDYQSNTVFKDVYVTRNPELEKVDINAKEAISKQRRVALVIGNAEYEGTGKLYNTVNDASTMAETLKDLGFEVTTILDGSYEDIKNAILDYGHTVSDVDVSLFYYAGHGLEIDGVNYLIPVDAHINSTLDVKQQAIPLTGILNTVEYTNDDGLNLIILDACRNNPFPTGKRGGAGLAKSNPPSGAVIAYSTAPGSVASDGDGENGLYTGELVKQLKIPQRIEDVFINTRNNVERLSNGAQQPWEEARLRGIFYLNY